MKKWLLVISLPLAFLSQVSAQTTSGFNISKTCPSTPVAPGSMFTCTFSVQNNDPVDATTNLSVTNTVPCPNPPTCTGGTTSAVPCTGGTSATSLAPKGTAGDTCTGSIQETAPACGATNINFRDQIVASGTQGTNTPISTTNNSVTILACTPTPTNPPINTPTPTRTSTPTATPANIPVVPTLSFPMFGLLALALIAAALFFMRRV